MVSIIVQWCKYIINGMYHGISQWYLLSMGIYIYIYTILCIYICIYIIHVYACGPKTVPVKRTFLNIAIVGWGGWGGHVNVPCTSYMKYCHAAEISGIVYYVTCCYAADGVGWGGGGMLTFLVLRTWNIAMLLRSLGSFTTLHVVTLLMGWGGVGWGCCQNRNGRIGI